VLCASQRGRALRCASRRKAAGEHEPAGRGSASTSQAEVCSAPSRFVVSIVLQYIAMVSNVRDESSCDGLMGGEGFVLVRVTVSGCRLL
jgi:hypothetical protein